MFITWYFGVILSYSLQDFCNGKEIFVSQFGRNNLNCTTMTNPCRTIQYAMDHVVMSNDVIKIDGSLGSFALERGLRLYKSIIITFTSYNGVAWICKDRKSRHPTGKLIFLAVDYYLDGMIKYEVTINNVNFRNTVLLAPRRIWGESQITMNLTVRGCHIEFSEPRILPKQTLIDVISQYSIITIENCTIIANFQIALLSYKDDSTAHLPSSIHITLRDTRVEDALCTVAAAMRHCTDTMLEKHFELQVVNSVLQSKGKHQSQIAQLQIFAAESLKCRIWLSIYLETSRFENFSVLSQTAAVLDVRGQSNVVIRNCIFKGNIGYRGGAISIQAINVHIQDSQFYNNKAKAYTICAQNEDEGYGGAIFVRRDSRSRTIQLHNSAFISNKATCFGSAVYLGYFRLIVVNQTEFSTSFTSSSDTIWFSTSKVLVVDNVSFEARDESWLDGALFLARSVTSYTRIGTPYFKCPHGSAINISLSYTNSPGYIEAKQVECRYCPKGKYTFHPRSMSGFYDIKNKQNRFQPQCQSCIFGAVCQRGIHPMPNFWGYAYKRRAFMMICPPGYCCQKPNQCTGLNSCNDKRAGRLCGRCKIGYFQSIFTTDCLEEKNCKVANFWTAAIMMCLLFTIIVNFLPDIFLIIAKILKMGKLLPAIKRIIEWSKENLSFRKKDGYQRDNSNGNERRGLEPINNESNDDGKHEGVERNDESKVDKGETESSNDSTAAGLIKIVFYFYQIHSIITVYTSNRKIQHLRELKSFVLSIFNLDAQVPLPSEYHCPFHGMDSTAKVWIRALFPVNCLLIAVFLCAFVHVLNYCVNSSEFIQKYCAKVKPRLLTAILQMILLGYSTLTSSILSLLTCLSLVNGERILYIDGEIPCYQSWQYAILVFIILWAIPLIYALHKLPSYMQSGEISIGGVYTAILLPLPFAVYTMVRSRRRMRSRRIDDTSNDGCLTPFIPYIGIQSTNGMSQLLNVIEGPFRYRALSEKERKLSWEPILLLQRILLSLCHTFVLEPGIRSLLLLLLIVIYGNMSFFYRPFNSGFLNTVNGLNFMLLFITGAINAIYAFIYEYGSVPKGPLVQLLSIFDYIEVMMIMIFPVIVIGTLVVLAVAKFTVFVGSFAQFIITICKRCKSKDK